MTDPISARSVPKALVGAAMLVLLPAAGGLPILGLGPVPVAPACPPADPTLYDVFCPYTDHSDPNAPVKATCLSYGLLVVERDLGLGAGTAVVDHSESRAWTTPIPGDLPKPRAPFDPPAPPQAHADAHQVGGSYSNPSFGLAVDDRTVFSRCDVASRGDVLAGPVNSQAYGHAGLQDFSLTLPGLSLDAEVLDYEINAYGTNPGGAASSTGCDIAEASVSPLLAAPFVGFCAPPNTGVTTTIGSVTTTVVLNEEWPPTFLNGVWLYGGAVVHVQAIQPGVSQVDVYVGYVTVGVAASAAVPTIWVPNGPCGLPPPLCD